MAGSRQKKKVHFHAEQPPLTWKLQGEKHLPAVSRGSKQFRNKSLIHPGQLPVNLPTLHKASSFLEPTSHTGEGKKSGRGLSNGERRQRSISPPHTHTHTVASQPPHPPRILFPPEAHPQCQVVSRKEEEASWGTSGTACLGYQPCWPHRFSDL